MKNSNESSILPRRMAQTVPEKGDGMMGEVDLEVGNLLRGGPMEFQLNEGGRLVSLEMETNCSHGYEM